MMMMMMMMLFLGPDACQSVRGLPFCCWTFLDNGPLISQTAQWPLRRKYISGLILGETCTRCSAIAERPCCRVRY